MRVLVVHHGLLPPGADEPDRPVSGGALRASWHILALREAGFEVSSLTRAQDAAGGFDGHADLLRRATALAPDRVVVVQPEDAPALAPLGAPMAVDLYAPRLLEGAFEGALPREAAVTLAALASGDVFLASNARQRWSWLGVLALAGLDLRRDPSRLVPLVAEPGPPRQIPDEPVFVAGGGAWAWQDPREALRRALAHLDRRGAGRVIWYGGRPLLDGMAAGTWRLPEHPRLEAPGWTGRRAFLAACAGATAAIDWMAPNLERGLAFAFRHADYLGAGLPILTGPDTALTDLLGEGGWVGEDVEGTLDEVLDRPDEVARRGRAAAAAGARLSLDRCEAPLVAWARSGERAPRTGSALWTAGALAREADRERIRAEALAEALRAARAEVEDKRAEVGRLAEQVALLTRANDRLARAIDEVAGFKREAVAVLGGGLDAARLEARAAERELSMLRADLAKKNAELDAASQLQGRLENDLRAAHAEIERLRGRGLLRR